MPAAFDRCRQTHKEAAYLAGFIDGDGCILMYKTRGQWIVRVDITQKNKLLLERLQEIWGGFITNGIRAWHLNFQGEKARQVLEIVVRYGKLKVDEAGLGLLFLDDKKNYPENLALQMRQIKEERYA
ncbi:hypothetical protein FJY90_03930 [Candidatus Gottesmanbacteria bacterium]|nr:hypothetical protein [Candidatus Gottesmanbacteria bacterium]